MPFGQYFCERGRKCDFGHILIVLIPAKNYNLARIIAGPDPARVRVVNADL